MNTKHFNAAVKFGRQLIETQDLDPVYTAIHGACLEWNQRARLVLAYSCLYHLGAAAYLSQFKTSDFWCYLKQAAHNLNSPTDDGRWPRGAERRHWRGKNAINTVEYFQAIFKKPEDVINYWLQPKSFESITNRIKETPSFGNWISFKIFDLADRVLECEVHMEGCELAMYEEPMRGAALIITGDQDERIHSKALHKLTDKMINKLNDLQAPPDFKRPLSILEIETCLCKGKSFLNGHYWVGKDIHELRHALNEPVWGVAAKKLLSCVPAEVPR